MERTEKILSNIQIVTLAISELGGATQAVDIEDIAIQAYELAPKKFSWRKYPERIDLRVVQYALKDAASNRQGEPLIKGSLKYGYMLTAVGLEWLENNQLVYGGELAQISTRKQSTADKLSIEQARLLTSTAFIKFKSDKFEEIKYSDFQEFVRVNDYFPEHVRQKRYGVVENAVHGNPELEELWILLTEKFVEGET
jgi:hypothetical protein